MIKDLDAAIGLCVDYNAGNMYWANPKDSLIEMAHLNGSSHFVLVTSDLDKPISLDLDPSTGLLFWSDIVKGRIERAGLDGSNRIVIINEVLHVADIALDVDVSLQKLNFVSERHFYNNLIFWH